MKTRLAAEARTRRLFVLAIILCFLIAMKANAQTVFSARIVQSGRIEVEISVPSLNTGGDQPVIKLFEVVKGATETEAFERTPVSVTTGVSAGGNFIATVDSTPPVPGFDHFEIEVLNYKTAAGTRNFRAPVYGLTAAITQALGGQIDLTFTGLNITAWNRLRTWISVVGASNPPVTVTFPNGTTETMKVTNASFIEPKEFCPPLSPGQSFGECTLVATFDLNGSLPVSTPAQVTITFPGSVFAPNPVAGSLPLDLLKNPIGPAPVSGTPLTTSKERDPIRTNVIEAGGSYNTSIKLDPDPTTNKKPERETQGSFDLRLAAPTITFDDRITRWYTWTPVQLDALVSTGKLTGDSVSTNSMRLFTQLERVYAVHRERGIDFFRIVGEGGVSADRDLRVLEYTGVADFRYNPAFLNRVLNKDAIPDLARTLRVEFVPFGVELGHRQVRRDPLFLSDDFIRRFRFAGKLELMRPPFFQFVIENRSWWRGEVAERKFKNYFNTELTIFPAGLRQNFSAGVFLSYERGSLPPFTTQRISTFKLGFRVRRKNW